MARRARGIRKDARTGNYQARFVDAHGRRRSKTFKRQGDAVEWLRAQAANRLAQELGREPPVAEPVRYPPFHEFARAWVERRRHEWSKATVEQVDRIVRLIGAAALGRLPVNAVDFLAVEAYLERLATTKGKKGRLPGYYECRNHLVWIRRITKRMQVEYAFPLWACETVMLPKSVRDRKGNKRPALTPEELGRFLGALDHPEFRRTGWRALFWTLAATGMRPAEALALRRECVDFDGACIKVRASAWGRVIRESTKTDAGREPAMAPELAAVLSEHLQRFPTLPRGLLFPARGGGVRGGDTLRKPFARLLEIAKIEKPGVTVYSLRNSFNSIAEAKFGESLAVRDTLGHVGRDMTERYYRSTVEERIAIANGVIGAVTQSRPTDR